jgi:glutathione S-transferase
VSREAYVLYGVEFSLSTRKLQAALRFYGLPFRLERKQPRNADEIERRAGTHQVPVLRTPENWLIADTTPILDLLDARVPARRLFPEGPLGVLVHVVATSRGRIPSSRAT